MEILPCPFLSQQIVSRTASNNYCPWPVTRAQAKHVGEREREREHEARLKWETEVGSGGENVLCRMPSIKLKFDLSQLPKRFSI